MISNVRKVTNVCDIVKVNALLGLKLSKTQSSNSTALEWMGSEKGAQVDSISYGLTILCWNVYRFTLEGGGLLGLIESWPSAVLPC